jgi:hypothetical protein
MHDIGTSAFVGAGLLNLAASMAHLACIALGPRAYRLMGAGGRLVRAVEAGKTGPALVTLAIAGMLLVWAAYAFSAAGVGLRLPFTEPVNLAIGVVFLSRAFAFPLLKPLFPDNSVTFWRVSSGICLLLGVLHVSGVFALWTR